MSLLEKIDRIPDRCIPGLEKKNYPLYVLWREICHLAGSLLLIGISHALLLLTSINFPFYVFVALIAWMTYQEFYLHPKRYGQKLWKGILDWLFWIVPFTLYFILQ